MSIPSQSCPDCGAEKLTDIAAILGPAEIERILTDPGRDPQPPYGGRAREATIVGRFIEPEGATGDS